MRPAEVLTDLLAACEQTERSFREAAKRLQDPILGRLLESYAEQRTIFGRELRRELIGLGQSADEHAESRWGQDRRWRKIPEFSRYEGTVVAQCARREESSVRTYEDAVGWGLAGGAGAVVERQYLQVKDAQAHLRSLAQSQAAA
jgi:uncharacterized protein (TIGR02284 family)